MHAVGLELVNHVYSAKSDLSAALPTAPRWNLLTLNVILMSMKPDNLLFVFFVGVTIIQNLDLTLQPKSYDEE